MATGVKLFHSSRNLRNYVLVKPTENKVFLYRLEKDGSIKPDAKPLMEKTYTEDRIDRKAFFPPNSSYEGDYYRYNMWKSRMPRQDRIPKYYGVLRKFSIVNKDGESGDVVNIEGYINRDNELADVEKLKFPLWGYNQHGITNLARIYLKKIFNMFSETPMNKHTGCYVSPENRETLNKLDKHYGVPKFEITDEIKKSVEVLSKKYNLI